MARIGAHYKVNESLPTFTKDLAQNRTLLIDEISGWANDLKAIMSTDKILPYKSRPQFLISLCNLWLSLHETIEVLRSNGKSLPAKINERTIIDIKAKIEELLPNL